MSRTYKDRPYRIRYPKVDTKLVIPYTLISFYDGEEYNGHYWIELPGLKKKLRKEVDTENHWMSTPSAWTRLMMNRPERRAIHLLERKTLIQDLEEVDIPDTGRKPHIYYW
jgi:hypothetical protein